MKFPSFITVAALLLALPFGASAQKTKSAAERAAEKAAEDAADAVPPEDFALERRAVAEPSVVVTICVASGNVTVRGWDRGEVRARSDNAGSLRLLTPNVQPAPRVEVLVSEERDQELNQGDCGSTTGLEVTVPRGATVSLRVREGHAEVSGVTEARVEALSGDVDVRDVSKAVEVNCMSGDVTLEDSGGRTRVRTVSGAVEVRNVRALSPGDELEATSTSGDVIIEGVTHSRVSGATVSGNVLYTGSLAGGGSYDFKTISGDVTVELPPASSFNLRARVIADGEIITDFPVRMAGAAAGAPPAPPAAPEPGNSRRPPHSPPHPPGSGQTRLDGTVGSGGGGAVLTLSSFNGTLHLKKH